MLACSRSIPTATNKLPKLLTPLPNHIFSLSKNQPLKMEHQPKSKRPTCPTCSKPLSLCLCTRLKTPNLDNKVHVTILQHSLEKKHPLNSARIAKLGLKNVDVFTVSDVMFDAQFVIRSLGSDCLMGVSKKECTSAVCRNASESLEVEGSRKRGFDRVDGVDSGGGCVQISEFEQFSDYPPKNVTEIEGNCGALPEKNGHLLKQSDAGKVSRADFGGKFTNNCEDFMSKDAKKCNDEPLLSVTIGKYGKISCISHQWKLQDEGKTLDFDNIIASPEAVRSLARGFLVTKLQQKQQQSGSIDLEQVQEFEIAIPPGSALLFPAQKSLPIEAIDFEVKNLIVLDGTWAKANRMYNENPWLRVLPCVRLDVEKMSLFSEVRHQPKPGCLSTIESIVYALEALDERENLEGLERLLDVFASMVEDQRRCKDERLRKASLL